MQCRCCMYEIENGKASCPVCGFPTLGKVSADMQSVINEYRQGRLRDISIGLTAYRYSIDPNGTIVEENPEFIKIAEANLLSFGEVFWFDKSFENVESDRSTSISVSIMKGEVRNDVVVEIDPDCAVNYGKIGIYLDSGFTVKFAIGDEEKYILTNAVPLMN